MDKEKNRCVLLAQRVEGEASFRSYRLKDPMNGRERMLMCRQGEGAAEI